MGERPAANNRRPERVCQIPSSSDGLRAQSEPRAGEGQNIRTPGWPCFKSKNTLKEFSKLSPSLGNGQVTGHGWGAAGGCATGLPPTEGNRKKRNLSSWSSGGWQLSGSGLTPSVTVSVPVLGGAAVLHISDWAGDWGGLTLRRVYRGRKVGAEWRQQRSCPTGMG